MVFIGIIILSLIILSSWRRYHHNLASLRFKYKIYSLRDELRFLAINGDLKSNEWIFDFFDNSFSKAISGNYYITLFRLLVLSVIHDDNVQLESFKEKLNNELEKNEKLKDLQERYLIIVRSYVLDQHYVSVNFILKPIAIFIFGTSVAARKLNSWLKGVLVYPETSASDKFAY